MQLRLLAQVRLKEAVHSGKNSSLVRRGPLRLDSNRIQQLVLNKTKKWIIDANKRQPKIYEQKVTLLFYAQIFSFIHCFIKLCCSKFKLIKHYVAIKF